MTQVDKLVILDRDGVINYDSPDYIKSVAEWRPIPGSIEAIAILKRLGFKLAIATNQSGIGRGLYSLDTFLAIQQQLSYLLEKVHARIDHTAYCPHTPEDNCACRKPKPGMLLELLNFFALDPSKSQVYFVGDSATDIAAAIAACCQPILVTTGKGKQTQQKLDGTIPVYQDLLSFATELARTLSALRFTHHR